MRKLWLMYALVSVADLTLTGFLLEPSLEANLIASWIWTTFGFYGLILYKIFIILFIVYPVVSYVETRRPKAAKTIMSFGIILTATVCLMFGFGVNGL